VPWRSARALLAGERPPDGSAADAELTGCLAAVDFLDREPGAFALPWRPGLIRHLHGLLLGARSGGDFRAHPVQIVRESGPERGQVVFAPPHPARVSALMERLLEALDPASDPFQQAAVFHYEFQSIHPFADGNGRLGRLLSTALARRGWTGRGFYVAPAVKKAGAGYYLALRAVRPDYQTAPRNGLLPWIVPFLDMLEDALRHPEPPADPESRSSA
jgi:Fic family protein